MRRKKNGFCFCLAALLCLTGCESVVKEAKPPEQYLDSQVLDGNFIDFSDPQQVYKLYEEHYAAMQRNPNYTSYSELRGGLDLFGIPEDWSKNFISFDIVDYDENTGNLIYALMTTNRTESESKYEYTSDAEVTIGEDGKITVTQERSEKLEEDPFLIAAVGFYNLEADKNQFFFIDKDYTANQEDAGNGRYSLVVKLQEDTVAVLYKEEILFYPYDSAKKTYVLDPVTSYNMKDFYLSTSFVSSAREKGLSPVSEDEKTVNIELEYQLSPSGETIARVEDQERIQSYLAKLNENREDLANALLEIMVEGYSPSQLDQILNSTDAWKELTYKSGTEKKSSLDALYACLNAETIAGGKVEFDTFHHKHVLFYERDGAAPYKTAAIDTEGKEGLADQIWLMASTYESCFFVPFTLQITFSAEPIRTYEIDCEFYFRFGTGIKMSNADWGDAQFTIHDIHYAWEQDEKSNERKLVPDWLEAEYSNDTKNSASKEKTNSSQLMERLQELERKAETDVKTASKWLDVSLKIDLVGKSYQLLANSQIEISSLHAISELMEKERSRIKEEIQANEEKYRKEKDVTKNITEKHLTDLQTMLARAKEELEEEDSDENETVQKTVVSGTGLAARFCKEDGMTSSEADQIAERGPELLEQYRAIYCCQEQLKKQKLYVDACQYIRVNEVYDQMLNLMDSKLEAYADTQNMALEEKTALREALDRQLVNRGISFVAGSQEPSVDEQMLPQSILGQSTEDAAWDSLQEEIQKDPEHSDLFAYLNKNQTALLKSLTQTVEDLKLLKDAALMTKAWTETGGIFAQTSETEAEEDFYTVGYERVLFYYQNALDLLKEILEGAQIDRMRDELHRMEDEELQISRFDSEISEERKEELMAECDRMELLLKTIYTGSSEADRNAAEKELEETAWQIDVNCEIIEGKIVHIQEETPTRTYYDTLWSASVNRISDAYQSYVFSEETTSLYFNETENRVELLSDAPSNFTPKEKNYVKFFSMGFFESCEKLYGSAFFEDMDQALITSVQYKEEAENKSLYEHLPDNRCQIFLLSQAEGRNTDGKRTEPKCSFMALPYSKLGLNLAEDNGKTMLKLLTALGEDSDADTKKKTLEQYGFASAMGVNNEMIYTTYMVTDYTSLYKDGLDPETAQIQDLEEIKKTEASETAVTETEVKIRGMLREENTIFLDNPKLDWNNPQQSCFYFLNLSLDEGIRMYALRPGNAPKMLERQNAFQSETSDYDLENYTEGCWFMGWWYPDEETDYNDQGILGGGKLVLLGLSRDDMKKYSSEEDGSLRALVADDIRHARLYELSISSKQMNACKK